MSAALVAVLNGASVQRDLEYACPSPSVGRWYVLRITPLLGPEPGVLISHLNITRHKHAERALADAAATDPLTGLANGAAFHQRLREALLGDAGDAGLIYVDLDRFDLFAVLVHDTTAVELTARSDRLRAALDRPHRVHGCRVEVTATVGSYLATGADAPQDALDRADDALARAKRERRR